MSRVINPKPICFGNIPMTNQERCEKLDKIYHCRDRCVTESIMRDTRRGMDD